MLARTRFLSRLAAVTTAMVLVLAGAVVQAVPADAAISVRATTRYTAVHLSWKSQGSGKTYQVQYSTSSSFKSAKSLTTKSTSTVVNHLSSGKAYYFRVRVSGKSWSPAVRAAKTSRPKTFNGNAVQKATKISTDNVTQSSIDMTWSTPSGQYACFRIQVSPTPADGQPPIQCTTAYTLLGLSRLTTYSIKIYTVAPAGTSSGINWPAIDITGPSSSISRKTSNYTLGTPTQLHNVLPQRTNQATLAWSPPEGGLAENDGYRVVLGDDQAVTKNVKTYAAPGTDSQLTVTSLASNHVYYARVFVVDANGAQKSDRSGYRLVKTLTPYGFLVGKVVSTEPTSTMVAVAYDGAGELDGQADIAADGTYRLSVPPGPHRVRISYIAGGNAYSSWVSQTNPAVTSDQATVYTVNNEADTPVADTTIQGGFRISGVVRDAKTNGVVSGATVSLQARNAAGGYETLASTYTTGSYQFLGVPGQATYRLRVTYLGSTVYRSANVALPALTGDFALDLKIPRR